MAHTLSAVSVPGSVLSRPIDEKLIVPLDFYGSFGSCPTFFSTNPLLWTFSSLLDLNFVLKLIFDWFRHTNPVLFCHVTYLMHYRLLFCSLLVCVAVFCLLETLFPVLLPVLGRTVLKIKCIHLKYLRLWTFLSITDWFFSDLIYLPFFFGLIFQPGNFIQSPNTPQWKHRSSQYLRE